MEKRSTDISGSKGTYMLIIDIGDDLNIKVGCLGRCELKKGTYIYIGSARGPGGLKARINRHLKLNKKVKWHIDYLTVNPTVKIRAAVYLKSRAVLETIIAKKLLSNNAFEGVIKGFGCTDRKGNYTHLYRLRNPCSVKKLIQELIEMIKNIPHEEHSFTVIQ